MKNKLLETYLIYVDEQTGIAAKNVAKMLPSIHRKMYAKFGMPMLKKGLAMDIKKLEDKLLKATKQGNKEHMVWYRDKLQAARRKYAAASGQQGYIANAKRTFSPAYMAKSMAKNPLKVGKAENIKKSELQKKAEKVKKVVGDKIDRFKALLKQRRGK